MQRPYAVDQSEHTVDERLSLSIVQGAQGGAAAQMGVVVRIASGTSQGTFARNFDRERGAFSFEDFTPRTNHFGSFQTNPFSIRSISILPG
jgi:hypothetical protein